MRATIVLAAGTSRRFGRHDKMLALLFGRPLILHAIDRAREAGAGRLVIAADPCRPRLIRLLRRQRGVTVVSARAARDGLAASLSAALDALRPIEREALVFLGDMPFARAPRSMVLGSRADAVRPFVGVAPGHPVLMRVTAAARATGDRGPRFARLRRVPGTVANLIDVDGMADLRTIRLRSGAMRRKHSCS